MSFLNFCILWALLRRRPWSCSLAAVVVIVVFVVEIAEIVVVVGVAIVVVVVVVAAAVVEIAACFVGRLTLLQAEKRRLEQE